jgi:hypothetical protein
MVAVIVGFGPTRSLVSSQPWYVEPGQGVGPLRLGMTLEEVTAAGAVRGVTYLALEEPGEPWRVSEIYYTGNLKTREGIGVGSSLTAVLRAYGGTQRRTRAIGEQNFLSVPIPCVTADIQQDQGTIFFIITYNDLGVRFDFASLSPNAPVSSITINRVTCDHP